MKFSGTIIILGLTLIIASLYFYITGFSGQKIIRVGQYGGLGFLAYSIIDEFFQER